MRLGLATFGLCFTLATAAAAQAPLTDYLVTPALADGALQGLDVELRFLGDGDGTTTLLLPDQFSGEAGLHRAITGLRVEGAAVEAPSPARRLLRHAPAAPLVVRYRLATPPSALASDSLGPQLRPDGFVVLGETAFVVPNGLQNRPAAFRWGSVPAGWTLASDLDHLPAGRASSLRELMDSALVGGAGLTVLERRAGAGRLRMAVVGRFLFDPAAVADALAPVVETSNRFWGDLGEPYFVVLNATPDPSGPARALRSQRGVGLGDAFALYATPDIVEDVLQRLLTHEHLHAWLPRRLGGVRVGDDQRLDAWFSEGVTEFLSYRLLLRSGAWTPARFAAAYDEALAAYAASGARSATNPQVRDGFWRDAALRRLPYQRGLLLATLWDARLRSATGGRANLDDVLRRARAEAAAAGETGRGPTAPERFVTAYAALGGGDLDPDLARFVERGEAVRLPADVFGPCARVETAGAVQRVVLADAGAACAARLAGQ